MGQYWKVVNLDKKEYIDPHKLGCGLKLWEQLANHPSTGSALIILCAAMPERRGGGDLDMTDNRHGENYPIVAKRTIGRWAGDRIALVGDYAADTDLPAQFKASEIYSACRESKDRLKDRPEEFYKDITDDVCRVIEHELNGKFEGEGWRSFELL